MIRFWPTAGIVCLLAGFLGLVLSGVRAAWKGYVMDPQGQWFGKVPLDGADDCRIRLMPTGQFDLECRGAEKYVGQGQWMRDLEELNLLFTTFARDGKTAEKPKNWRFTMSGGHNSVYLTMESLPGEQFVWSRARP